MAVDGGVCLTHNSCDQKRIVKSTLSEEKTRVDIEEGQTSQLLGTDGDGRTKCATKVSSAEAIKIRIDQLLPVRIGIVLATLFFEDRVLDDGVFKFDIVVRYTAVDTAQACLAFLVQASCGIVRCESTMSAKGLICGYGIILPGVSGSHRKIGSIKPRKAHWVRIGTL